jgi:hypothetical protein
MAGLPEFPGAEHRFDAATSVAFRSAKERFSQATEGYVASSALTHKCRFSLVRAVAL